MADEYGSLEPYGTYGDKNDPSPYDLLMQMKAWNKEIYLTIENMDKEVRTALEVLDGEIRQNILDVKQGLETNISTTAAGLTADIKNTKDGLQTQITANANGVASKVSKTDYNGTTVASLITQTPSAITMMAQALNLQAYVTFSSLTSSGTTVIDGSRIQTGYISADRIQASTVLAKLIAAGGISADQITSGTISAARLSANAITTTLLYAGGISADLITGGTISGISLSGVSISATTVYASMGLSGSRLDLDRYGQISFSGGGSISQSYSGGLEIQAPGGVSIYGLSMSGYALSDTSGLGFGYSSTSKRLYVRLYGSDVGYVTLT